MTQEEKELLLKDLCARLPYGVHVEISWEYSKTDVYTSLEYYEFPNIDSLLNIFWDEKCISIRPYLRPMSSMTEEKKKELRNRNIVIAISTSGKVETDANGFDWLNAHHFDYRTDDEGKTMIEKGLALKAPEGMYDIKHTKSEQEQIEELAELKKKLSK